MIFFLLINFVVSNVFMDWNWIFWWRMWPTVLLFYFDLSNITVSIFAFVFPDLQLKPYRTDDFITKLYYETSRFSAFNHQWVIKARINNDKPTQSVARSMSYQLVLKGKITNPIQLKFIALKGPYGDMKVNPAIYMFEFSPENVETEYFDLPIVSSLECNKLLASKTINVRLIMVHLQ